MTSERAALDVRRTGLAALAGLLGAVTLKGLLLDNGWLIDVALTIVVVTVPAALLRLRRAPSALDVWPGVLLMIPWLTARFVRAHAIGGVIPTRGTFHALSGLMTDLHRTTHQEVAPIHSTPAVRLVLCALIGLLTALIDLIAVVGRRGALAGIPLLVIYTVSGAVPRRPVAWEWFVAAACGFLLLLSLDASDDRALWGHRVANPHGVRAQTVVTRTAPRLGAIAVILAIVLPLAIPVGSTNLIADVFHNGHGGAGGFGARDGGGGSISPFAALRDQLNRGAPENVMTVHVAGDTSSTPFYLRVNVLDKFSDQGWSVSDHGTTEDVRSSDLEARPVDDSPRTNDFEADITIAGLTGNAPIFTTLDQVDGVAEGTDWSPQDQVLLGGDIHRGQKIVEKVKQPEPTIDDLQRAGAGVIGPNVSRWLTKPTLPGYVTDLVSRLTRGQNTEYDRARAISNYFADPKNGFFYSLSTPVGDSGSALVDFLKGRQGFCQQYAAAMAIMLRQAGVPSRVVLGYMHEEPDPKGNFTVTTNDAHAWVEAYFDGVGWVPFDPTPTTGLTGGAKSDLMWAPHDYSTTKGTADPTRPNERPSASAGKTSAVPVPAQAAGPSAGSGFPVLPVITLVGGLVVILAIALLPAGVRERRRRRRLSAARRGDTGALWDELADSTLDLGYVWSPARSPRQVATWLARDLDTASHASLSVLAAAVERARFGRDGTAAVEHETSDRLVDGLREVCGDLRSRRSWQTRMSARFWPRSLGWRLAARRSRRGGRVGLLAAPAGDVGTSGVRRH